MKKSEIKEGGIYCAKVSGHLVYVQINGPCQYGGWYATNRRTHNRIRIKSAQKLRWEKGYGPHEQHSK